jgi:putative ABC transport system substrate-binding protein
VQPSTKSHGLALLLAGIIVFCSALTPLQAHAAGDKTYRVAYLQTAPRTATNHFLSAMEQSFRELGYQPGKTLVLDYRFADGKVERLPELARELAALKPDVFVTALNPVTVSVLRVAPNIPIVTTVGTDMVEAGLAQSLARPGGTVTGLTLDVGPDIIAKRLQLLREAVPAVSRLLIAANPDFSARSGRPSSDLETTARSLGLDVQVLDIGGDPERFSAAFADTAGGSAAALYIFGDPFTFSHRKQLVGLAAKHRLPAVAGAREYADDGALFAYGADIGDLYRRAAGYVDRILKGAKAADLPIEQPSKFQFIVNQRTAKALGITLPPSFLLRADEVLE